MNMLLVVLLYFSNELKKCNLSILVFVIAFKQKLNIIQCEWNTVPCE